MQVILMKNCNYFGGTPCSTSMDPLGVTTRWLNTTELRDKTGVMFIFNESQDNYLFVFSIAVRSEAFGSMELDGGAADHLNAALLVLRAQGPNTTAHLRKGT